MPWPHVTLGSLTGAALTFLTLWFHAFWVFGVEMDYLNGGMQPMAPSLPVTTLFFARLAVFPAVFSALLLAVALTLTRHHRTLRRSIVLPLWLFLWILSADAIAAQFAIDFGTTWQFTEPFSALMAHAVLTPASLLIGLTTLWLALR